MNTVEQSASQLGYEAGKAAGSWVIDGNTTEDTARNIVQGYENGDPQVMDMQPSPLSGEWADDPTEDDVILSIAERAEIGWTTISDDQREELITSFEDGYSEGFWAEVIRAANAVLA